MTRRAPAGTVVTAIVVVAALCAATTGPARAQTGGGELGPGSVRATAADLGAGTFGGGGLPAVPPSSEPPLVWSRATTGQVCVVFASPPPPGIVVTPLPGPSLGFPLSPGNAVGAPPGAVLVGRLAVLPPDARVVGDLVVEVGDDRSRNDDIVVVPRCIGPGEPVLAAPPSAAEIWQETPLPRAVVRASPPGTRAWPGITRLGTDFRSDPLATTSASVSLHGFDVDVVAVPIAYAWSFGDGTHVVAPDAGAPTRVAYLRRGDFAVTRYVVWEGRARLTLFGLDLGVRELGTVTIPEVVPYRVAEIRALLRSTPGRG